MLIEEFTRTLNKYGKQRIPFLFLVDFEMQKPLVFPLDSISGDKLLYNINGRTNAGDQEYREKRDARLVKFPISFAEYQTKYDRVKAHLAYGDSYLTNLTAKTRITTPLSLKDMFFMSGYTLICSGT